MVFTISRLQLGQQLPFVQTSDELANYMSRSSVFDRTIRFDIGRYDFLSDGSRSGFFQHRRNARCLELCREKLRTRVLHGSGSEKIPRDYRGSAMGTVHAVVPREQECIILRGGILRSW